MASRSFQLALLPALLVVTAGCPGRCATNQLWNFIREDPIRLEAASITEDDVLHLALRYDTGRTWLVRALLKRNAEWPETAGRRVKLLDGPLPPSARRLTNAPVSRQDGVVSTWFTYHQGPDAELSHTVWVTGGGYSVVVDLPAPVNWDRGIARLGVLLTPFTVTVDALCAPAWVAWCFLTAGCHGPCPIPWCRVLAPPIGR